MPVEKMEMAIIVGEYDRLDDTAAAVLDSECFHAEHTAELIKTKGFHVINDENPYTQKLQRITDLFGLFDASPDTVSGGKSDTGGYPEKLGKLRALLLACELNPDFPDSVTEQDDYIAALESSVHKLQDIRRQTEEKIAELQKIKEQLSHFTDFSFDVEAAHKSRFIHFRFGRMPAESVEKLSHYNIKSLFVPCSYEDGYCWGLYLAPLTEIEEADRIFASLFFERLHLPHETGTPAEISEETRHEIDALEEKLAKTQETINEIFTDNRDEFASLYASVERAYKIFETRRYAAKYKNIFMLMGWVPKSRITNFTERIARIDGVNVEFDDSANPKITPPTRLKNPRLFRPFQFFVEIFGVPSYSEIDPTAFLAVTYTLLYGIMFADLGQGLVLALVGFLMYRLKKMPLGKILIPCGISGAVFGTVFGSVFGYEHWLDPLYRALGFREKPIEIMSTATYLLAASIGIGVVLVIIAMCLNIVSCIKRRDIGSALFGPNGVAGIVLYCSLIVLIAQMFLNYTVNMAVIGIFGLGIPIVLIFLKEPLSDLLAHKKFKPDSVGDFILVNFFELFEVILSYMTNTLSFLRVGAFILIHAGMMTAFSAIAELFPNAVLSAAMMVFGNIFVIALEGLLVGIQVLRLEFYEMFSRYYDGQGKTYSPLKFRKE